MNCQFRLACRAADSCVRPMNPSTTFRASTGAYVALCGPLLALGALAAFAYVRAQEPEWGASLICFGVAFGWAIWLSRFRLKIGDSSMEYATLFQGRRVIQFSDIDRVMNPSRTPTIGSPLGLAIRLKDASLVRINLKVFPIQAARMLLERMPQ